MYNRRIVATESGQTSYYIYDSLNPVMNLSGSAAVTSRRLYSRSVDNIVADEANGQTRWFLTDQVGTVRDIANSTAGILNHYIYDSFGRLLSQTNGATVNDLLFTGREISPSAAMTYSRARFLDTRLGRFAQEDQLSPFGYTYASSNPLVVTDPLGLSDTVEEAELTTSVSRLANSLGYSRREIRTAIHALKRSCRFEGNPDILFNPVTGDAYLPISLEYIACLLDYLP